MIRCQIASEILLAVSQEPSVFLSDMRRRVKVIYIAARSIFMLSALTIAHWRASSQEIDPY